MDDASLLENAQSAVNLQIALAGELAGQSAFTHAGWAMAGAKVITMLSDRLKQLQPTASPAPHGE